MAEILSLPSNVVGTIGDFCTSNEVLALSVTCHSLQQHIEKSMVSINCERIDIPLMWKIPIFFPEECHSVFVSWFVGSPRHGLGEHTITLESHALKESHAGEPGTVVWKRTFVAEVHERVYISFRNDPTQEYFLRCEYDSSERHCCVGSVHKQYMVKGLTPARTHALTTCMEMGRVARHAWRIIDDPSGICGDIMPFFMELFVLCFESLSDEESASDIRTFFDETFARWNRVRSLVSYRSSTGIRHIQKQVCNIFEQALEQNEPANCIKVSLSPAEVLAPPNRWSKNYSELPQIHLRNKLVWKQSLKRRHGDQEGVSLGENGLEFVARIPLIPNTTQFRLFFKLLWKSDHEKTSKHVFVLFFQKRESSRKDAEHPIEGKVFDGQGHDCWRDCAHREYEQCISSINLSVPSESESCFLYYVPDNATKEVMLLNVSVILTIAPDLEGNMDKLCQALEQLLAQESDSVEPFWHFIAPLVLLHRVAKTLQGPDQQRYPALKEALDRKQLDTTSSGLECLMNLCDVLLRN